MQQVIETMHGVTRLVFAVAKAVFSSVPIIHLLAIRDEAFQYRMGPSLTERN